MNEWFTSLLYPLSVDERLGRIAEETDYEEHVEDLIRQVLFTNPGERVNRPRFGCGLRQMVFAPNQTSTASLAEATVREALETWLGSVLRVEDLQVESRDERLVIRIEYSLKARPATRELHLEVRS